MTKVVLANVAVAVLSLSFCVPAALAQTDRAQPQAAGGDAHALPPTGPCGVVAAIPAARELPPPVPHAEVRDEAGRVFAVTNDKGAFCLPASQLALPGGTVVAPGYLTATWTPPPSPDFWAGQSWVITLEPAPGVAPNLESVEVTAYRTPLSVLDSPASTRTLSTPELRQAAGITLDDKLREIPGFELFRRTSALVANPTTQGVSLRGLGSTAASRTLVVSDDVPLNEGYGGWIYWDELPSLAIKQVEIVRGGASDLYGSSAIGGVVNVMTLQPPALATSARQLFSDAHLDLLSGYGAEGTSEDGALGTAAKGPYGVLAAAGLTATDGYVLVAPSLRGPVDTRSNLHAENALVEMDRAIHTPRDASPATYSSSSAGGARVFLRGNVLNENRHNGTPLERNATRLWRYATGAELNHLSARAYGSTDHYLQTFSAIEPGRASETLTRTGEDPADALGASARWTQPVVANLIAVAGADVRDVRAEDISFPAQLSSPKQITTARQRQTGVYGELLATPGAWTLSGSARVDHFTNGDAAKYSVPGAPGGLPQPSLSETVVDPRLGLSRRVAPGWSLLASGFRAYRAPTENELYRTGQVGQQTTLANPRLKSERATGWEAGLAAAPSGWGTELRASYFWTQVNRPITALTLLTTPTATTLMRENLGQIESRGISMDASVHPAVSLPQGTRLTLEGGYQYAVATVTSFAREPTLVGKWIPQVARQAGTLQATLAGDRLGVLSLQTRASGRQFDDDVNHYELHSYVRFDLYASHSLGFGSAGQSSWSHRFEVFAAVENLLDRSIDAGRTPVRTLATPQLARFGLRLRLGE